MQAVNDEERVVGQRTWGPKGLGPEQASSLQVYIQTYFYAGKLQMKLPIPTIHQLTAKTSTGNGTLQP